MPRRKHESDSDDEHPLPITSYNTLKDRQLKDILAEQGLSVLGSRTIWEQRHQRYVVISAPLAARACHDMLLMSLFHSFILDPSTSLMILCDAYLVFV